MRLSLLTVPESLRHLVRQENRYSGVTLIQRHCWLTTGDTGIQARTVQNAFARMPLELIVWHRAHQTSTIMKLFLFGDQEMWLSVAQNQTIRSWDAEAIPMEHLTVKTGGQLMLSLDLVFALIIGELDVMQFVVSRGSSKDN